MSLRVTFLGTGGAVPTTERAPSALFVNREGDRLLFDCGEGTQRGMMRFGTGFGIDHLFVSHLHGDHVLGIPGLVQTLGFNDRAEPLTIHCPPGTEDDLHDLVHAVGHDPAFQIRIESVAPGEVALDADGYEVRAFETVHRTKSQGYVLEEDDRPGRFDRPKAEELGVPVGPKFGRLHEGEPVEAEDGSIVEPDQVVGPPRPGRKFVYTADTRRERGPSQSRRTPTCSSTTPPSPTTWRTAPATRPTRPVERPGRSPSAPARSGSRWSISPRGTPPTPRRSAARRGRRSTASVSSPTTAT